MARMDVPYYVFPHGMLDPWFRRTYPYKHLKKCLYWPWADYRVLRDARAVLFTSDEERRLASQSFALYRANERVVSHGISTPPSDAERLRHVFLDRYPELRGQRILLFLGRIHEKKGCDLLIRAFSSVLGTDPRLRLVMAGPDQTGWGSDLREIASAESLACGVPVLISDKVNIWREIVAGGAGFVESDDMPGTQRLLTAWLSLDKEAKRLMRESAVRTFERQFHVNVVARNLLGLMNESVNPAQHYKQ